MASNQYESKSLDVDEKLAKDMGTKPKVFKDGDYLDPVLKKLSKINGEINKLTKAELQKKMKELGLDTRGVKEVLRKRLKNYYKRKKLGISKVKSQTTTKYDYLAVIDFEATCEQNNVNYRHEIIEFPVVLIDVEKMEIVEKFHEYVRPLVNPVLTDFCINLTGITQETVDKADIFPDVLLKVEDWMEKNKLGTEKTFAVLTDGPWDMFRFMYYQCKESDVEMPAWSKQWINIRKSYCNFYQCGRGGIEIMLKNLGMKFEGSPHSGIDDSVNISRIAIRMMSDGCPLHINERIQIRQNPYDSKVDVRYEPFHNEEEEDVDDADQDEGCEIIFENNLWKQKKGKAKKGIEKDMESLTLKESAEQQGENVDDLLQYYKLQKS